MVRYLRPLISLSLLASLGALAGPFNREARPDLPAVLTPDARGRSAPDRTFDVQKLNLDLDLDPAKQAISGVATFTVMRLAPGPLVLDQVALTIDEVRVGGQLVAHRIVGDTLVIPLEGDRGQVSEVAVRYAATPRTGLHFRGAGSDTFAHVYSQGEDDDNRHWFPGWDHPNDRFVYTATVRAPAGWRVLTNPSDSIVNYLIMLAAGPYDVVGEGENTAWLPPGTPASVAERVRGPIPAMMAHFGARTGVPYPWGPYRQIFVDRFLYSGMENTSATIMDSRLLVPDVMARTAALGAESVFAHELAHQWYGDLLTCEDWRELWLNEGFATFMANDYMASRAGAEAGAAGVLGLMAASMDGPALAGRFHQGPDAPENGRVYVKGASVLHMLRVMLGEDVFWEGIRAYTTAHQRGLVDSEDLMEAMEAVSGAELDWFFQQWVELPYVPELTVRSRWDAGVQKVTIRQVSRPDRPRYTLPVTVELGGGAAPVRAHGWLDDDELELSIPMEKPATYVAFDPEKGILAHVDQEQDPAAWEAQLGSASPFAVLAAMAALGQTDVSAPLEAMLEAPGAPVTYRERAAEALGEQRQIEPLLAALADPDDRIRRAAADALGKASGAEVRDGLRALIKRERNLDVVTSALRALKAVDEPSALVEARAQIRRKERYAEELRDAAADVLGALGEPGDLDLLLDPKLRFVRAFRPLWGAVHLVARQPEGALRDRMAARVARAAEPLLEDWDQRTREAAVAQLGQVGDAISVATLERFRRAEEVDTLKQAAADAIAAIASRTGAPPAGPNEAEARVEALEKRLEALEQEMEGWKDRH